MNIPNHETREYTGVVLERMSLLSPGGKMGDLPEHLQHESFVRKGKKKTGGPNMRLLKLEDDKPSLTVTAYIFNKFVHSRENRYITPREAAALQDFPIDYEFKGTLGQVQKQIGNAVPIKLASALASAVAKYFERLNKRNILKIASYFTGAGGLDLGFEVASNSSVKFETAFSTDIEKWAEATINHNRPEWNFLRADITKLEPKTVKKIIGKNPDIIIGGPPCQPFSVAGKQKSTQEPLGILYRYYIRHVDALKPEIVVMENVYGLAQVKSANMLEEIYKSFKEIGYQVTHRELMAADYGTPQRRRRLFFVAAKNLRYFQYPQPTHCETENLFGLPLYNGAGETLKKLPKPIIRKK
ncbi:DNA (cytosine-5-)-methyltransferase [Candidatus Parabeggiatoa sp. HSG14]|uniref:DNA (cytosine-5-)-methyltransferase n=1 Tax=Candidatus Parabeggiatoa sp. HSG14 TaxID=3055593 RepID=UPI0025A82FA9|nr:DNA (cytosine-5-)-methyltransferase [Thiotrichales bacterium HSG14]